jgi:hypothetical protein
MRIAGAATIGERHRAVFFERGDPCIGRGRHDHALDPNRDLAAVVLLKVFGARLFGQQPRPLIVTASPRSASQIRIGRRRRC